jgi:hypothetical protein
MTSRELFEPMVREILSLCDVEPWWVLEESVEAALAICRKHLLTGQGVWGLNVDEFKDLRLPSIAGTSVSPTGNTGMSIVGTPVHVGVTATPGALDEPVIVHGGS